ncbi:hypothetical protein AQUCO_01400474v1 [Aquilegia coerulea]|uniref:Cytochrome P450 n=1 Tax=Aquilegia coerulea TaxID=218851 RepID=A0A2G5DWR8_AQUCA|nr:hypothetical protein AQUCO_01400474v1 [Aquilegia coerulea]
MEFIGYPEMIFAAVCFLSLHHLRSKTLPTNWPFLGMLPSLVVNLNRVHDWCTEYLVRNGCTFVFEGPWFTNMNHIVVTSDPANMRHIFNTNFSNYPKGAEFNEFFDILGDGIFNADLDSWKTQRKLAHHFINDKKFQSFLEQTSVVKVESGLIPVLDHVCEQNLVVDLQDLLKRFTFDTTLILLSGIDPCCLAIEFDKFPYVDALDDAEEAIFHRHVIPVNLWKLQRFLGIGKEKKLSEAKETLDQFIARCISTKRELQCDKVKSKEEEKNGVDLLTAYMEQDDGSKSDMFFRDTVLNFLVAGRSTLSAALTWFFWLVSNNPIVEAKLIEELKKAISPENEDKKVKMFDTEDLKGLVYLHGAFCEVLRLFPSVPFEHKTPLHPDILPSGHKVDSETKILPMLYSMGRMEVVWGKDCLDFKPERWITEEGGIKYVPSYKFMAFNSGPRTCLGKEIAFTQMRMVAATILYNYQIEIVEGHPISPKNSIILYMKHGMKVRIGRRV